MDRSDRRTIGLRETAVVTAAAAILTIAMTWPLVLRLTTAVPQDLGDPLLQAWQVAWTGHALRTPGTALFQANTFWPLPDSLAFTDALLGYAPAGLVGSGMAAAIARYDLLVLFACVLAAVGAYLLARELGARPLAAALAGVVFAWSPWRLSHMGHLHILSTGGIPLAVFLLLRGYRQRRWGLVLAGWIVTTWQVSLGFALAIPFAYALAVVAALAVHRWWRAGRPDPGPRVATATVVGAGVLLLWTAFQAAPYLRVADRHPEAVRTVAYLEIYSPPARGLLAAPEQSWLWGERTSRFREGLVWAPEQTLFPGAVAIGLAAAGLVAGTASRRLRLGLAVAAVVTTALALGTQLAGGRFSYLLLFEHGPGWQAIRTPGRLIVLTLLFLALLAALGADRLLAGRRRAGTTLVVALLALAIVEGTGEVPVVEVPRPPAAATSAAAPTLHLPTSVTQDQLYMAWTTASGFPAVTNGSSGFEPAWLWQLRQIVATFPDEHSVAVLRDVGLRTVVLHTELSPGTPWEHAGARDVSPLGIGRRVHGSTVVFDLRPDG